MHRLQMLWLDLESDLSFSRNYALNTFTWKQTFFGIGHKSAEVPVTDSTDVSLPSL